MKKQNLFIALLVILTVFGSFQSLFGDSIDLTGTYKHQQSEHRLYLHSNGSFTVSPGPFSGRYFFRNTKLVLQSPVAGSVEGGVGRAIGSRKTLSFGGMKPGHLGQPAKRFTLDEAGMQRYFGGTWVRVN